MSLDVYLILTLPITTSKGSGIFIRENGQTYEITREEWDAKFPDKEPITLSSYADTNVLYQANITHNLNAMARLADLYKPLWRPEEIGITKASQLIEPLTVGLAKLEAEPDIYKVKNPSNGWGNYEGLVQFTRKYLAACKEYPDADVKVSR